MKSDAGSKYLIRSINNGLDIKIEPCSWQSFNYEEFPPEQWRVKDLIPVASKVIIAAPSGEKKSWFVMELARCIASGEPFLGRDEFKVKQGKVLYIENESPRREVQRRGRLLNFQSAADHIWLILSQDNLDLGHSAPVERLYEWVKANNIETIIIDTFRSVSGGLKEEKAEEMRQFFSRFNKFVNDNITVIFTDHCRKTHQMENKTVPKKEQLFGSQDKLAVVECLIMLRNDLGSERVRVHQKKNKSQKECKPFSLRIYDLDEGTIKLEYEDEIDDAAVRLEAAKEQVMTFLAEQEEMTDTRTVVVALQGKSPKNAVEEALKSMRESEEIEHQKEGRKFIYRIKKECDDDSTSENSSDGLL